MPSSLINPHTGQPIPSIFGPAKRQITLTPRDGEILCHITQWEYLKNLKPTLVCRSCWNNARINGGPDLGRGGDLDKRNEWEIVLKFGERVEAQCACTRWATECAAPLSPWLGQKAVPKKDAVQIIEMTPLVLQKPDPLSGMEASLLQAWKMTMDKYGWSESLECNACFESGTQTGEMMADTSVHAYVIPNKKIVLTCACSRREWVGVPK